MDPYAPAVEPMMKRLFGSLKESDRRRYAAVEAAKLGHGGIEYIAGVLGCDPKTIRLGIGELEGEDDLDTGRCRKKPAAGSRLKIRTGCHPGRGCGPRGNRAKQPVCCRPDPSGPHPSLPPHPL